MPKIDLLGLFAEEISEKIKPYGLENYRGRQIAEWLYQRYCNDFMAMSNLSKSAKEILAEHFSLGKVTQQAEQHAENSATSKFLLGLDDRQAVETVLMRHSYGNSACVSTQVGCNMGCIFCASTIGGIARDLTAGEILAQVLYINKYLGQDSSGVNSIVIMGSGEPLLNYDNVLRFIRLCHETYCFNLSYRSFTLSTAGIIPGMDRLAAENLPITLAVSLHAPNNELRSKLMPINKKYPLEDVLAAADRYTSATGRRVTYEYTLIAGLNDSVEEARQLTKLLKGKLANVNLIPVNPVAESGLLPPGAAQINQFLKVLRAGRINVTVRREMGSDIKAACGQLRRNIIEKQQ